MKKLKYLFPVWILISSILFQNIALAAPVQKFKNTAPVANFTVEKSREVKLLILTDYTGVDNANLRNSITSMKADLANYAKINIEFAAPTDATIGTQQGIVTQYYWGKNGYATYRWTGYDESANGYGQYNRDEANNKLTTDKFIYSKEILLPEGQTPNEPYGVPVRFAKSELIPSNNQSGYSMYYTYNFINNSGICDGYFNLRTQYGYYYPNGAYQAGYKSLSAEPTFTYEDFWSIQGSTNTDITNNVTGWDLSTLNYEVKDTVDTFVIFALNDGDTNYYTTHLTSNYRLGQLRSDSNLGKYVKDSDARVYSICSDNLENINLSTNAQYPVTFSAAGQNISLKDLINSSFDGRSIGDKNVNGLVNKIKENVKRPSDKIDMVVATDNDISSTNNFVNSIRDNISSDVDLKANVVDMDSLDTIDTWTKYVVKGDYKNIYTEGVDVNLILLGNGDLWARGSNALDQNAYSGYGLFGQSTTTQYYNNFIKIASNVKDAEVNQRFGRSIFIIKNDGTLWVCGAKGTKYNSRTGANELVTVTTFTQYTEFSGVRSLSFKASNYGSFYVVTASGVFIASLDYDWSLVPPTRDNYAPANTEFVYVSNSQADEYNLFYISLDGSVDYTHYRYGSQENRRYHYSNFPCQVKDFHPQNDVFICTDGNVYNLLGNLIFYQPKQVVFVTNGTYVLLNDGRIYDKFGYYFSSTNIPVADKILFVQDNYGLACGLIVRTLDGRIGFLGSLNYANLFSNDNALAGKTTENRSATPIVFDVSINDTAAEFLQVGNHFAYVTKVGVICFKEAVQTDVKDPYTGLYLWNFNTVNCGKFDAVLDTSTSIPVKAFSKAKILNTSLREGSERYFVYISDNIAKDTYFNSPSDYFLFGNLDYDTLNYLYTNKFNIYIVTPEQARNLKLTYPYVPVNRQQYSLSDMIYNSSMDSAFCRDTDTVRKLIIKKYDTYTKQGTTTLTVLVNEESVRYNQIYSDFENDPKYSEKWMYTHDPDYFDNSNGLDSLSGQWITNPLYTFSKVGKYTVISQFRDNPPRDDDSRDNYRLWSNKSAPATIFVHRRPFALFTVSSRYDENAKLCTLRTNNTSYDLDHQISRTDKGIAQSVFEYKLSTNSIWASGLPTNVPINKTYNIRLKVRDIEGAWSNYYYQDFTTVPINSNEPPEVTITKSLSYVYEGDNLVLYMKPTDPDSDPLDLILEEKKDSGSWKTVFTESACASGSTQTYSITKMPAGNYQYRVTVTDPDGESGSDSLSFTAYPLGINGIVDHTPIWKTNWTNYNKHLQSIGKPTYGNDTFFTGEKYVLSAITTKISPESNITASNVSVKIIERTYSPVWLTKQSSNTFNGEFWNEDMRGTRWRGKQATFLFSVTYSNGTVKTDSVITNIVDDDYFRVKMAF